MSPRTTDDHCYVGIDLGGTNVKVGIVNDAGRPLANLKRPTHSERGAEAGVANILRCVEDAVRQSGVKADAVRGIGVATPGTMDIPSGMMLRPHNLPGWNDVPIRDLIADHFGKPAFLQNDANAAAYGEYWVGAGRDSKSMVMWTLGTGIGCGIIIHDMIIEGEHSTGSECGHVVIEMDNGRYCDTGQYGTLEAYTGAKYFVQRALEALAAGRESSLREVIEAGDELTPLVISQAADAGDQLADDLIMDSARYMGIGTTTVMHTIDPDCVLLGGAMTFGRNETPLGRRFIERIREEVRRRAFPVPAAKTLIDYAQLGEEAGYIGAAGWARRKCGEGGACG
ncbi:MAG: ROK family protein [Planctomycetaceae bacterium]